MSKWWDEDVIAKPQTNDLQEGDFRTVSINEDGHAPYRVEIYEDGAWVEAFPRLDAEGKVPNATLQTDVAILGDDGKVPNAVLQDSVSILGVDGKLPDANLSTAVPLLAGGLLPRGFMPQPLLPAFDRTYAIMSADQTTGVGTSTLQNLTELVLPMTVSGGGFGVGIVSYRFEARLMFTVGASGGGVRFSITGPTIIGAPYVSRYPLTATTETVNYCNNYGQPAAANASVPGTSTYYATIEGFVRPFVAGNLQVTVAADGSNSVTVLKGSHLMLEFVNQATWVSP